MMKILVDNMPLKAEECPFAEYVQMTSKYKCNLKPGLYSRCDLECNKSCDKLKKNKKMKYYIGESWSTGRYFYDFNDFVSALKDLSSTYENDGEDVFEIEVVRD